MSHHRIYNFSKKWLSVRQVITQPIWINFKHGSNVTPTDDHPTSIPQPISRLNRNFVVVRDFIENHIEYSYLENLTDYLKYHYFSGSLQRLPTNDKLKNLLAIIKPEILHLFLSNTLQSGKNKKPEKNYLSMKQKIYV